jgi:uncharacterized protein YkwD
VTLARRDRFTNARHATSPEEGRDVLRDPSYGAEVPSASAAAPARVGLTAALLATCAAFFVFAGSADGGARAWNAYLAPASACKDSTDAAASLVVQRRAVACLINWARKQEGRAKLAPSNPLNRAAGMKGQKVASCGQFSHTPCGSDLTGPLKASGYPYASFGENLFVGSWGAVSAREVVTAWLQSQGHRENILRPYFRDVGAAAVRAQGLLGGGAEVVWVTTFGSQR